MVAFVLTACGGGGGSANGSGATQTPSQTSTITQKTSNTVVIIGAGN